MKTVPRLTLEDAKLMIQAAEKKAQEIEVDMDIAIVDDGGNLLMFQRMDNARITSITIAIDKAFTAGAARKSTRAYGEVSGPGSPAFGINSSIQGRFMIFAGGLPIFIDEHPVGGIGCSSGSPDQDEVVAQAGIEALMASI
ncbi:MAG: heme-binding protein [Desulfobacterales bacterium]|nr:heme-binding protein [Deltaproteobacteria bacterium]NNK93975.1 heme-binding protein [Desulfobacterales bacterium]